MRWSPTWLLISVLTLPAVGLAQESDPSSEPSESATSESTESTEETQAASTSENDDLSGQPIAAVAQDTDDAEADDSQPPAAPKTESKASAKAGAGTKAKKGGDDDKQTALLGAANPLAANAQPRPWNLFGSVSTNFGTSNFLSNPELRRANLGYSLSLAGLYKISNLFEGRLDIFGSMSASQALTTSFTTTDPTERRFYFNDVRVGFLGRNLVKEPTTGIIVSAGTNVALPTSEISQETDRILAWSSNVNLLRVFQGVGPGMLILSFRETFWTQFGPRAADQTVDIDASEGELADGRRLSLGPCPTRPLASDQQECISSRANANLSFTHSLGFTYLISGFSFSMSYALTNTRNHYLGESELPADSFTPVTSPNATQNGAAWTALQSFNLSIGYAISRYFNVSLGMSTNQGLYEYNSETGQSNLQNPFIDTDSFAYNATSFFAGAGFVY